MEVHQFFKERLEVLKSLYDAALVINPEEGKTEVLYHDFKENYQWLLEREGFCEDSISMNAYINKDVFVKVDYCEGKMLLINAAPVTFNDKIYILETIKDITSNSIFMIDNKIKGNTVKSMVSEMNEKIIRDYLTGIYNRRYINERLPKDIRNSLAEGKHLSIIMADIDHFKNVNDSYGHLIGDEVLIDFAGIITRCIRQGIDWVGRYGGEEFLIVLKDTEPAEAYRVAEKIRNVVAETTFTYEDLNIHITSSFGVHGYKNDKFNAEELISQVDKKLYAAKASGRNKTIAEI